MLNNTAAADNQRTIVVSQKSMKSTFKQSHEFIFSSQDFTSAEEIILSLLCSRENVINVQSEDNPVGQVNAYLFEPDILVDIFNTDSKNLYALLNDACKNLMKTRSKYETDSNGSKFEHANLFTKCVYDSSGLLLQPSQALYDQLFLSSRGFAEIEQGGFVSVRKNRHAMRLLRILSRFKNDSGLHPLKLESLKTMFGVYDEHGNVLKKSYTQNSQFMNRVIKPAIEILSNNSVLNKRLTLINGQDGNLGYQLLKKGSKVDRIKFLYKWSQPESLSESRAYEYTKDEAYNRARELMTARRSNRELSLEELYELKACFEIHEKNDFASMIDEEIIQKEEALKKMKDVNEIERSYDFSIFESDLA